MSPALNGSTALQRFKYSNAVEICNGITFNFYLGLPHLLLAHWFQTGRLAYFKGGWMKIKEQRSNLVKHVPKCGDVTCSVVIVLSQLLP